MKFSMKSVALAASLALLAGSASAALAKRAAPQTLAVDNGLAASTDTVTIAVSLKVNNLDDLKAFVASTVDPASANYQKFLTPEQFAARYGQSSANVLAVKAYLEANGLTVTQVFSNNLVLMASGTNAQLSALFGTTQHSFTSASGGNFQRVLNQPAIPAYLQGVVAGIHGLSTEPRFRPHNRQIPAELAVVQPASKATLSSTASRSTLAGAASPAATPVFTNPQSYGVKQVATRYNVDPLYAAGYNGTNTTLGIMTFAGYTASWATTYWSAVGVTRTGTVTVIKACPDGTTTCTIASTAAAGSGETALDVEQSGGLAPGANLLIYEAPNTDAGAIALYTKAITDNKADTLSISWGLTEVAYGPTDLAPYDPLFLQAAAQGVPVTAASADGGAYDAVGLGYPFPNYSPTLAVDFPASHPYVVGAGGTTLPLSLNLSAGTVTVPAERPWGWDYLQGYISSIQSAAYYYANYWPVGAGGGRERAVRPAGLPARPGRRAHQHAGPGHGLPADDGRQHQHRHAGLHRGRCRDDAAARRLRRPQRARHLHERRPGDRLRRLLRQLEHRQRRHQLRRPAAQRHLRRADAEDRPPPGLAAPAAVRRVQDLRLRQRLAVQGGHDGHQPVLAGDQQLQPRDRHRHHRREQPVVDLPLTAPRAPGPVCFHRAPAICSHPNTGFIPS